MPTADLPERPNLDSLRRQARALQRAVRAGEPAAVTRVGRHHPRGVPADAGAFQLSSAQLVLAREYGFASWTRLTRYLETVTQHGWQSALAVAPAPDSPGAPAAEFCRLACLTYSREDGPARWAQAKQLLAEHPDLTNADIWAAAAAARPQDVARLLTAQPRLATERGGPFRWRPLYYLAYSRFDPHVAAEPVLAIARALLDAGADPDEGYLFDALPSPFTLLTGVFGEGELGPARQPRHPHWPQLGRLLLDAGADPHDAQTLYNRMFSPDDSHLELLFEYGLGTGQSGPWRARLGELLSAPTDTLRILLRWAVEHHQPQRVRLLVEHGVDFRSPFTGDGPAWSPGDGRTPVELAALHGDGQIADYLLAQGAPPPAPDPARELIAAAFRADPLAVERIQAAHPDALATARTSRPGLMVWAATRAPRGTIAILAELGFDVNAYGRGDAPVEQPWETALHHSAAHGDLELTRHLLSLGADPDLRDSRFDATPLGWARHFNQLPTAELLEPLTR